MCGISVLLKKQRLTPEEYSEFFESLKLINYRDPDDGGIILANTETGDYKVYYSEIEGINLPASEEVAGYNLALGQKRLSILDLSAGGHQPKQGRDGSWIVFNGEIYNYIEVRDELKRLGCVFETNSDTEVILEAYRVWGKDCLNRFNGMWAFVIWDAKREELFISNDRFGVKPLYYCEQTRSLYLVSETKQLRAYKKLKLELNKEYLREFSIHGFVDVDEETAFKNVSRFKRSHYSVVDTRTYEESQMSKTQHLYYTLTKRVVSINEQDAVTQFREILEDAVRIRMRADVDFGFALSGGLDSSAILYMAKSILSGKNERREIIGFAAVFPGNVESDESTFVNIVEKDTGCKVFYTNSMEHFDIASFEKHLYHQDFPIPTTSYYAQWNVYELVQTKGLKILFNGQGADELFAGYHHHFYKYCAQLLVRGKVRQYFSLARQYAELKGLTLKRIHSIVFGELKISAKIKAGIEKFDSSLLKHWSKINNLDEMLLADFTTYQLPIFLRADDRDSMAYGIESRHPFLDYRMVEFGYSLPNELLIKDGWQKYIMRKAMHEMPHAIRYRRDKKGYATPESEWIRRYKSDFESYLKYNLKLLGTEKPSKNEFYNYALGAWFKINGL